MDDGCGSGGYINYCIFSDNSSISLIQNTDMCILSNIEHHWRSYELKEIMLDKKSTTGNNKMSVAISQISLWTNSSFKSWSCLT